MHLSAPQALNPSNHSSSAAPTEYSTHPGWLQSSGRNVEGRKTYVMVSERGVPFYYVTAESGVNLDQYVRHRVECFGEAIYNGDLRQLHARSRVELRDGQ